MNEAPIVGVGLDTGEGGLTQRQSPSLVEQDFSDVAGGLEGGGVADEDAPFRRLRRADHHRRRNRQTERAGACDHQHRDHPLERPEQAAPADQPPARKRRPRQEQHGGHEHRRGAVGEPLPGRFARLGLLDESADAGRGAVAAGRGRREFHQTLDEPRAARDGVARLALDRHRLAGQERLVDCGAPLDDGPVDGNGHVRRDPQSVAGANLVDRDYFGLSIGNANRGGGDACQQGSQRQRRTAACAGLEVLSKRHEEHNHDRGFKEHRQGVVVRDDACKSAREGHAGAERHQQIHVGAAVQGGSPRPNGHRSRRDQNHEQCQPGLKAPAEPPSALGHHPRWGQPGRREHHVPHEDGQTEDEPHQ